MKLKGVTYTFFAKMTDSLDWRGPTQYLYWVKIQNSGKIQAVELTPQQYNWSKNLHHCLEITGLSLKNTIGYNTFVDADLEKILIRAICKYRNIRLKDFDPNNLIITDIVKEDGTVIK